MPGLYKNILNQVILFKRKNMANDTIAKDEQAKIEWMKTTLLGLIEKMANEVEDKYPKIEHLHPEQKMSSINLIQYLTLRSEDVRSLQDQLHVLGLSSLASSESHSFLPRCRKYFEDWGSIFHLEKCLSVIITRAEALFVHVQNNYSDQKETLQFRI